MRLTFSFLLLVLFTTFICCNRADPKNSRAYIQGKIAGENIDFPKVSIRIFSDKMITSETSPDNFGKFTLSGPLVSKGFSLVFNKKIRSFSTSKSGCKISPDSMAIEVPENITYLTFNEIILE